MLWDVSIGMTDGIVAVVRREPALGLIEVVKQFASFEEAEAYKLRLEQALVKVALDESHLSTPAQVKKAWAELQRPEVEAQHMPQKVAVLRSKIRDAAKKLGVDLDAE